MSTSTIAPAAAPTARICPVCGKNELQARWRKCEDCLTKKPSVKSSSPTESETVAAAPAEAKPVPRPRTRKATAPKGRK